jgi:hypothetical protein
MFRLIAVAVAVSVFFLPSLALGAEVKVEGVLKAVDAKERTLTVEKKTAKGTKDVSLEVAEEAGDLTSLKVGDEVALAYDSTLEVVTKISGPAIEATEPEVVGVKELGWAGNPWLTRDGLTIYFTQKESPQAPATIWAATRASPDALFKDKKEVAPGIDFTFSDDGLEGIVFSVEEGKGTLQTTKRKKSTDDFGRPTLIRELGFKALGDKDNFIVAPCLSADGLTLYCEVLGKGPCFCTRDNRAAPWSKPSKVPLNASEKGSQRFPFITDDGLWLFCTNTEIPNPESANIALYTRKEKTDSFAFTGYLQAGDTPLNGEFPRYVSATKELFFVKKKDGRPQIYVVKNFEPINEVKE